MRKISRIKLLGHIVEVRFVPHCELPEGAGSSYVLGNIIKVCSDYPISQQEETLLHEIMESSLKCLGYQRTSQPVNEYNEQLVIGLSGVLYQVLRDNQIVFTGEKEETDDHSDSPGA